jgi:hypothetical protein
LVTRISDVIELLNLIWVLGYSISVEELSRKLEMGRSPEEEINPEGLSECLADQPEVCSMLQAGLASGILEKSSLKQLAWYYWWKDRN